MTDVEIPLFDMTRIIDPVNRKLKSSFDKTLKHSRFIMGPEVTSFESSFSNKVGSEYCISSSSGTDALLSIFMALDIEPGSEVLVPSFTFVASASSILRAGLKPVFVDVAPDSFHPSLSELKDAWTKKTKAVLFVHLFGEPEDLSKTKEFCDSNGAYLIEDCAQSFGSTAGRNGIASAYSFFPAKNLGCLGDGGAVTTDNEDLAKEIEKIRFHGCAKKYVYETLGGNFRLDTLQAGFLSVLLEESDGWIEKRRENATYYTNKLANIVELTLPKDCRGHAWNQYTLRTSRRDELKMFLDKNKIGNAVYYPIPLHHSENIFGKTRDLPNTEKRCKEVLSIPIYPGLKKLERELVVKAIKEFFNDK